MRHRRSEFKKVFPRHSKIGSLTEEQQAQLRDWFVNEEISYAEGIKRLKERFGLDVGCTNICNWWHRVCGPIIIQREQAKKGMTAEITVRIGNKPVAVKTVNITTNEPLTNHEHTTGG
jgi:hypothetical protein